MKATTRRMYLRTGMGRRRGRAVGYVLLAPALLLHVLVIAVPSVLTFLLGFYNWNILGAPQFIGLQNFTHVIHDPVFYEALSHNGIWTVIFLTVPVAIGLAAAVFITRVHRGQMVYRILFYLPATMASVVVARVWQWILDPFNGIGHLFAHGPLRFLDSGWLSSPGLALYSVASVNIWAWWGFLCLLFVSSLGQIDPSWYEAASLEGASGWQQFRSITLPRLRPVLIFILLLTMLWSFTTFDYPYLMTGGGPAHASEVLSTWIYFQLVNSMSAGYAAALATTTTVLLLVVIVGYIYVRIKGWETT